MSIGSRLRRMIGARAKPANGGILITGAAGEIATAIRPLLRTVYPRIRLTDCRAITDVQPGEEFFRVDLGDAEGVASVVAGVEGIIHLGAASKEALFDRLLTPNIIGAINLFEAARHHAVNRVVVASTMHVLGLYRRDERISPDSPPRPDSRYAVTKLFSEHLASLYAAKYRLKVTCLRIGHCTPSLEKAEPGVWMAASDLVSLIRIGLEHPDIEYEVFHCVSEYDGDELGQARLTERFGYRPSHRGGSYAEAMRQARERFSADETARSYRGAWFASAD